MFVRFQIAVLTVALTALAGSALERSILDHSRALARQHYRLEVLRERVARARLETERLSAPALLARPLKEGRLLVTPATSAADAPQPPLLHWRAAPSTYR